MSGCQKELILEHVAQVSTNCKDSNEARDKCPQNPGTEAVNKPGHNHNELESLPPPPLFIPLSYPASCSATPLLLTHPQAFCHYHINPHCHINLHCHTNSVNPDLQPDPILHSYGLDCQSPEDVAKKTLLRHDETLLAEYIRSNRKLAAQIEFMKTRRKKKQTDHDLIQDYRFIVSLYTSLQTMEFKPSPHRCLSSKAILSCLNITASLLSRAKQIVKLLDEIGPDGSSPDPMVIQRLQSKVLTHKGSDLLTFLKQQDRGRQVVHSLSPY